MAYDPTAILDVLENDEIRWRNARLTELGFSDFLVYAATRSEGGATGTGTRTRSIINATGNSVTSSTNDTLITTKSLTTGATAAPYTLTLTNSLITGGTGADQTPVQVTMENGTNTIGCICGASVVNRTAHTVQLKVINMGGATALNGTVKFNVSVF
jgi:hypothetical protein